MADDAGEALRRSLGAVDRHRQRLMVGLGLTVVLLLLTFVTGARAARNGTSAVQAFVAHFMMLVIWMTALTLVVVIQITVMTKRILRAIELASKK
jgi:heme/copper-type cytochrome/quinol oxidase subunit 2